MNEQSYLDAVIARFARPPRPGEIGPGDDGAVFSPPPGMAVVATVDSMVEGTHFISSWLTDAELGARILCVSLSDLAAMGAAPRGALIAIETPELPGRFTSAFWDGVDEMLRRYDFALLGGNVTRTSGPVAITSTLLGLVPVGDEITRSGAAAGDELWVTGAPGSAGHARALLARGDKPSAKTLAWTRPAARVREALWLSQHFRASAAIDVSDGLAIDCARLCHASGCGAEIDVTPLYRGGAPALAISREEVLEGGEDYELVLAMPPTRTPDAARFQLCHGVTLTRIGVITKEPGLRIAGEDGAMTPYRAGGWDPFRAATRPGI